MEGREECFHEDPALHREVQKNLKEFKSPRKHG